MMSVPSMQSRKQTTRNRDITYTNKYISIYYSHPIYLCNSALEKYDLIFLKTRGKVVNPNGLNIGKSMIRYIKTVKDCNEVWYHGNTIGVVFEVLSALSFGIPVYSIESKDLMTYSEIINFVDIFNSSHFIEKDKSDFKLYFPEYYNHFSGILRGDL